MAGTSEIKLRDFYFNPVRETRTHDYNNYFPRRDKQTYTQEEAQEFVRELEEHIKVSNEKLPVFWYIEFKKDYPIYSPESLKVIKDYFEGELVKIILDNSGIMAISSTKFESVKKKLAKPLPAYVASILGKKITEWNNNNKVSKLLLQQFEDDHKVTSVKSSISVFSLSNAQEEIMIKEDLSEFFKKKSIKTIRSDSTNLFVADLTKEVLNELIKKEFIEYIDPVVHCQTSQIQTQQPSQSKPQLIDVDEAILGSICVIDTGTSNTLMQKYLRKETLFEEKEDIADKEGHGTLVSSIAAFGSGVLNQESLIRPQAKIISYNIQEDTKIDLPLSIAISKIGEKEQHNTNIFNLSINYPYPPETEEELKVYINEATKIDKFIQQTNLVLTNSAGNVGTNLLKRRLKEPEKIDYLSVSSPAFAPNVFSVGSVQKDGLALSLFGLVGDPFNIANKTHNFRCPQIFSFGGDTNGNKVWCLSKNDSVCSEVGTSFSSPLIALACRKAMDIFHPTYCKNSESVKSIVLNSCKKQLIHKKTIFVLDNPMDVGLCKDSINFNFEGKLRPVHRARDIHKVLIDTNKGEFYLPKEAKNIEFVLVFSHNYAFRKLGEDYILPKLRITGISKSSEREIIETNIDNPNGQVVFGKVDFKRNYHGKWYFELFFEGKNIPSPFRSSTLIRYGLSIKVNLHNPTERIVQKAYSEVKTELKVSEIKDIIEENIKEKILSKVQSMHK